MAPLAPSGYAYGRRPGQVVSLAHPCSYLKSFGSKCTVLNKVLVTLLGLSIAPADLSLLRPRNFGQVPSVAVEELCTYLLKFDDSITAEQLRIELKNLGSPWLTLKQQLQMLTWCRNTVNFNTARILCLSSVINVKLVLSAAAKRCWSWISPQVPTRAFHWTRL